MLSAAQSAVQIPGGARDFFVLRNGKTGSGTHPASNSVGIKDSFPREKSDQQVRLTTNIHLMPRLRMNVAIPPLLIYVFKTCRENFIFSFNMVFSSILTLTVHVLYYQQFCLLQQEAYLPPFEPQYFTTCHVICMPCTFMFCPELEKKIHIFFTQFVLPHNKHQHTGHLSLKRTKKKSMKSRHEWNRTFLLIKMSSL
jgi:hypothetical protein